MKKYISVFTIMVMIFLAACSNQNTSSTPTSNENNTQSNSVTKLDEGVWPANEYTEGLPVAPGTVAWATLDTEHENCNINLTGISENDYNEYMELLNQEGFSVIENVSEEIEGENYVSIGTLLSNDEKWLSISYKCTEQGQLQGLHRCGSCRQCRCPWQEHHPAGRGRRNGKGY